MATCKLCEESTGVDASGLCAGCQKKNSPQEHLEDGAKRRKLLMREKKGKNWTPPAHFIPMLHAAAYDECGLTYTPAVNLASALAKMNEPCEHFEWPASRTVVTTIQSVQRIRGAVLFIAFDAGFGDGRTEGFRKSGAAAAMFAHLRSGDRAVIATTDVKLAQGIKDGDQLAWTSLTEATSWKKDSITIGMPPPRPGLGTSVFQGTKGAKQKMQARIREIGVTKFCEYLLRDRLYRLGLFKGATFVQGLPRVIVLSENVFKGLDSKLVDGWPDCLETDLGVTYKKINAIGAAPKLPVQMMCAYRASNTTVTAEWHIRTVEKKSENWLVLDMKIHERSLRIGAVHLDARNTSKNSADAQKASDDAFNYAKLRDLDGILGDLNLNVNASFGGIFPVSMEVAPEFGTMEQTGTASAVSSRPSSPSNGTAAAPTQMINPDAAETISAKFGVETSSGTGTSLYMGGLLIHNGVRYGGTITNAGTASLPLYARGLGAASLPNLPDGVKHPWMQHRDAGTSSGDMQDGDEIFSDHPSIYADYVLSKHRAWPGSAATTTATTPLAPSTPAAAVTTGNSDPLPMDDVAPPTDLPAALPPSRLMLKRRRSFSDFKTATDPNARPLAPFVRPAYWQAAPDTAPQGPAAKKGPSAAGGAVVMASKPSTTDAPGALQPKPAAVPEEDVDMTPPNAQSNKRKRED